MKANLTQGSSPLERRGKAKVPFHFWTLTEVDYLRVHARKLSIQQLANALKLSVTQVKGAIARYKISTGRDGKFIKGHVPFNKGKHFVAGGRSAHTRFKKGVKPHNTLRDLAITWRVIKGTDKHEQFIRLANAVWVPLRKYVWVQAYGPVPSGKMVRVKDGDYSNITPSNLMLVDRATNCLLNHNRAKAAKAMRKTWERDRLRKKYGLSQLTKLRVK